MPPTSWTSKWRMPSTRLDASRTTGEGLGQQVVQRLALLQARLELRRPGLELVVAQGCERRLQRVDGGHAALQLLDLAFVGGAEQLSWRGRASRVQTWRRGRGRRCGRRASAHLGAKRGGGNSGGRAGGQAGRGATRGRASRRREPSAIPRTKPAPLRRARTRCRASGVRSLSSNRRTSLAASATSADRGRTGMAAGLEPLIEAARSDSAAGPVDQVGPDQPGDRGGDLRGGEVADQAALRLREGPPPAPMPWQARTTESARGHARSRRYRGADRLLALFAHLVNDVDRRHPGARGGSESRSSARRRQASRASGVLCLGMAAGSGSGGLRSVSACSPCDRPDPRA